MFFAAETDSDRPLGSSAEHSAIDGALKRSSYISLDSSYMAATWSQVVANIGSGAFLHFVVHGDNDNLVFRPEDAAQNPHSINAECMRGLFARQTANVECVVINGCNGAAHASDISPYVDHVIAFKDKPQNNACITFSRAFYGAIADGKDVPTGYNAAISAMSDSEPKPTLHTRPTAPASGPAATVAPPQKDSPSSPWYARLVSWLAIALWLAHIAVLARLVHHRLQAQDPCSNDPSCCAPRRGTGERLSVDTLGLELVRVPAGCVRTGSAPGERDRQPIYEDRADAVELDGFYMAATPVTRAQYRIYLDACAQPKPRWWDDMPREAERLPVVGVRFADAVAYCRWAGLALPTEAQWEYAARGGSAGAYWSGDDEDDLAGVGWVKGNTKSSSAPMPVGEGRANPYGLYDVHGNVWEWCADGWVDRYQDAPARAGDGLRRLPVAGKRQVVRGGSWHEGPDRARSARRGHQDPSAADLYTGFRPIWAGEGATFPQPDASRCPAPQ